MQKIFIYVSLFALALTTIACEKLDNELNGQQPFNAFDDNNNIELIFVDSTQKFYGSTDYLKVFFHFNDTYVTDVSKVQRVIVYRDSVEKFRLSPGNFSNFIDITVNQGGTYNFQMQLLMKDSSYTKKTTPFIITF